MFISKVNYFGKALGFMHHEEFALILQELGGFFEDLLEGDCDFVAGDVLDRVGGFKASGGGLVGWIAGNYVWSGRTKARPYA